MPKFVIERNIPRAGAMGPSELKAVANKSNGVLCSMGPEIQWVQSYVTPDKVYCVYIAPSEDLIRRHAQQSGFPADVISQVQSVIDPTTAEMAV